MFSTPLPTFPKYSIAICYIFTRESLLTTNIHTPTVKNTYQRTTKSAETLNHELCVRVSTTHYARSRYVVRLRIHTHMRRRTRVQRWKSSLLEVGKQYTRVSGEWEADEIAKYDVCCDIYKTIRNAVIYLIIIDKGT